MSVRYLQDARKSDRGGYQDESDGPIHAPVLLGSTTMGADGGTQPRAEAWPRWFTLFV